ncbi:MAG: polyprenyl synthetase family protein [Candidatus Omnitrophica bacterium]|nr:polyprenyl synthetase family protein [Candidatus Omnitrophota bacterium]MDD5436115.1 polyprenyl synthetase family protein [Candidatus Omnitrophota bacterium]
MNLIKFIDKNLSKFLPPAKTEPSALHSAMRYSVFPGGKRIRPVVLVEAAMACGAKTPGKCVAAACAVELVHTYSLIHDDLPAMDDDDYRRGKPSCHKKFGEATAILAGDALLTLAFNILAGKYPDGTGARMVKELSSAIGSRGMVGGQSLDIANIKNRAKTNILKTAKLFEAAACMGALSAGASVKKVSAMRGYGLKLGMAFQAVDDLLDGEKSLSQKGAAKLAAKAKDALDLFGRRADRLKAIADHILVRNR